MSLFAAMFLNSPYSSHAIDKSVKSASIIWNVTPIASTMTVKAEFIDGQRCWDVS